MKSMHLLSSGLWVPSPGLAVAGGGASSPASLPLTGWWPGAFAAPTFAAAASTGTSGSNGTLTEATNPATAGTALNGYASASFDGVAKFLHGANSMGTFFSSAAGSMFVLFHATFATANPGTYYLAPSLMADDADGFLSLYFTDAGIGFGSYNGTDFVSMTPISCATGAPHLAQARWNTTTMELRLDSGAWQTLSRSSPLLSTGGLRVGRNYDTAYYAGRIYESGCSDVRLSDAQFNTSIKGYLNTKYAIAL